MFFWTLIPFPFADFVLFVWLIFTTFLHFCFQNVLCLSHFYLFLVSFSILFLFTPCNCWLSPSSLSGRICQPLSKKKNLTFMERLQEENFESNTRKCRSGLKRHSWKEERIDFYKRLLDNLWFILRIWLSLNYFVQKKGHELAICRGSKLVETYFRCVLMLFRSHYFVFFSFPQCILVHLLCLSSRLTGRIPRATVASLDLRFCCRNSWRVNRCRRRWPSS